MAPDPPPPSTSLSVMHATVGLDTLQSLPLPLIPDAETKAVQDQQQQQRTIFCFVYSALLDDVQDLDYLLESKFSKEILRIVSDFATSFCIQNHEAPELRKFSQRLGCLNQISHQTGAVKGLSGATALDYLVALMFEKSRSKGFKTLGNYQQRLANLHLAKAIRQVSEMEEVPEKGESPQMLLKGIGLPKVLFICVGPHMENQSQREGEENGKKDHKERDERYLHVVASSAEAFADSDRKQWAKRMHYERMRSVSTKNYEQVCATERAFFATQAPGAVFGEGDGRVESKMVKRANIVPHWQTMHHCPHMHATASGTASIAGPESGTEARIGVFNHACETAAAFSVHTGFDRRARCFKCASVYLYHQDAASIRAEADMNGPHRSEPMYDWTAERTNRQRDGNGNGDGSLEIGPSCAEPLGHLLCSELM